MKSDKVFLIVEIALPAKNAASLFLGRREIFYTLNIHSC